MVNRHVKGRIGLTVMLKVNRVNRYVILIIATVYTFFFHMKLQISNVARQLTLLLFIEHI